MSKPEISFAQIFEAHHYSLMEIELDPILGMCSKLVCVSCNSVYLQPLRPGKGRKDRGIVFDSDIDNATFGRRNVETGEVEVEEYENILNCSEPVPNAFREFERQRERE